MKNTYTLMHTSQTVEFVKAKVRSTLSLYYYIVYVYFLFLLQRGKWSKLDHKEMTVMEAVEMLDRIVDESDPDVRKSLHLTNMHTIIT